MRLISFLLSVFTAFSLSAGTAPDDTVKVSFRVGHRNFDPTLGNNREAMDSFINIVKRAEARNNIDSIIIRAYASPEGSNRANELLSIRRCDAIAELIATRTNINKNLIYRMPEGIAWQELRQIVASTPDVPSHRQVLDILDNIPVLVHDNQGRLVDSRKHRLMALDKGVPYRWMLANLFPRLRNAVAVALITKHVDSSPADEIPVEPVSDPDTELKTEKVEKTDNAGAVHETVQTEQPASDTQIKQKSAKQDSRFALKTNLLDYPILMPNIEIEWMFSDRWSVALEWQGAWYAKEPAHKVYRLSTVIPEVRYWPIERSRWHGMYVGVFAGAGQYDLSKGKNGHEGEGALAGVSAGYMFPIGKHLSLDAGLGIGYLRVRDKEYKPENGHYLYQLTKNINYFGPLRLKLSLVWRIPR